MGLDQLLEAKEQLCAVVPRKVSIETLEACELELHNLAVSAGSIRVENVNQALEYCSRAIVLRRSCGDDLSLDYLRLITKMRSLVVEICFQRSKGRKTGGDGKP